MPGHHVTPSPRSSSFSMCGRITLAKTANAIMDELDVADWTDVAGYSTGYNLAPTRLLPILFSSSGRRVIRLLQWGLVPAWADEQGGGARLINARSETAAVKPSFRHLLGRRHCVAMADGYYEWPEGSPTRQPWYIQRADRRLVLMAALWDTWSPHPAPPTRHPTHRHANASADAEAAGETEDAAISEHRLHTFTILTTSPNPAIAALHDRMPVILEPADVATWLSRGGTNLQHALDLMRPSAAELAFHLVSTRVNAVRHDDPSLILPVEAIPPPATHPDLFA